MAKISIDIETAPLSGDSEIFILDYPDLITTKAVTEEGRKNIQKLTEWMEEFFNKNDIKFNTDESN